MIDRLILTAACAGVLALTAAGAAQAQIATQPGRVVGALRESDLDWLAQQIGARVTERHPGMRLDLRTDTDFAFSMQGEACTGEGKGMRCEGLTLIATFTIEPGAASKVAAAIAGFNGEYAAAKTLMWDDAVAIERYVILTGGVTVEYLATELDVFLGLSDKFWQEIDEANGH